MHAKQTVHGIAVYVPTGEVDTQSKKLAPRLTSLRGARIGILDNCKEFADGVLRRVVEALKRDFGVEQVKVWQKSHPGIAAAYAQEMAAQGGPARDGVGHRGAPA